MDIDLQTVTRSRRETSRAVLVAAGALLVNSVAPISLQYTRGLSGEGWPFKDAEAWPLFAGLFAPLWALFGLTLSLWACRYISHSTKLNRQWIPAILTLMTLPLGLGLQFQTLSPFNVMFPCKLGQRFCLEDVLACISYGVVAYGVGYFVSDKLQAARGEYSKLVLGTNLFVLGLFLVEVIVGLAIANAFSLRHG